MAAQADEGPVRLRREVEAEAAEGLLLAEYATRMRLKNRIIVDIVTAHGQVDAEAWADDVRLALGRLRLEAEASARRMEHETEVARSTSGVAAHQHDYRASDTDNLEHRRRVYRLVGRRLLSWENDAAQVAALLGAARQDAQEEVDEALARSVAGDPLARVDDEAMLRERLRMIRTVDLPALEAAVRSAAPAAAPERGRRPGLLRRTLQRLRTAFSSRSPGSAKKRREP